MFRSLNMMTFSPRQLFGAGEVGVWYDPADLSTLFQDVNGLTPVTAVEQPVALILDKSKGLAPGAELVTNGDFSGGTTTGWTAYFDATLSIDTGRLKQTISGANGYSQSYQTVTVTANKWYKVSLTIEAGTSTGRFVRFGTTVASSSYGQFSTVGTTTFYVYVTGTSLVITPVVEGSNGAYAFFDNFSVKELPGNHATQSTSASRPVLSARYNLLTYTEQFDNTSQWTRTNLQPFGSGSTANSATAPDGTTTGDRIVETNDGATALTHSINSGTTVTTGVQYIFSFYAKSPSSGRYVAVGGGGIGGASEYPVFDVSNGTVDLPSTTTVLKSATITNAANGWYRCVVTFIPSATTAPAIIITNSATDNSTVGYIGNGTSGVDIWGADLRVSNDGTGLPAYQRVVQGIPTTTNPAVTGTADYDTAGFPLYLKFDGTDDSLATGSIDFSGTDKMTVWAGVRKLADVSPIAQIVAELSAARASNNGAFTLAAPTGATGNNDVAFASKGTSDGVAQTAVGSYPSPVSLVLTGIGNISGDSSIIRVNGSQAASSTADQGTGNFGNYPLYIGKRHNNPSGTPSSNFLNARLYQLIVRGASSTTGEVADTERWLNGRARAY